MPCNNSKVRLSMCHTITLRRVCLFAHTVTGCRCKLTFWGNTLFVPHQLVHVSEPQSSSGPDGQFVLFSVNPDKILKKGTKSSWKIFFSTWHRRELPLSSKNSLYLHCYPPLDLSNLRSQWNRMWFWGAFCAHFGTQWTRGTAGNCTPSFPRVVLFKGKL